MKFWYKLNSKNQPEAVFCCSQSNHPDLLHAEKIPDHIKIPKWDGDKWVEDVAEKEKEQKIERVLELKRMLAETDYVTLPDYDKDKSEVIEQRAKWRAEVRELEPLIIPEQDDASS